MAQLTQREFLFLDDLLHLEELQVKQCADLAAHCSDLQLQQLCMDLARRSQQNFQTLISHLNQGQGQSQAQSVQPDAAVYQPTQSQGAAGYTFGQ